MSGPAARYGGLASQRIDHLLRGAAIDPARAETLLRDAQKLDPECLPVYFALYKFYFYRARLADAERVTHTALTTAARQAGFSPDWRTLCADSASWSSMEDPIRFYLFSLKAMAFIKLRLGARNEADAILAKLHEIDPMDQVGASVIRDIAAGAASSTEATL